MAPLLVAHGLSKTYVAGHGRCWARVQVLASLALTVHRGERVVIVGARGTGKTTLLHCLTGLRRPDAGSVRWDATRGAPYRLCASPRELGEASRAGTVLLEVPDDPFGAGAWLEALHASRLAGGGWLVFASRPGPLASLAHRALELRNGALRPVVVQHPLRVAERL